MDDYLCQLYLIHIRNIVNKQKIFKMMYTNDIYFELKINLEKLQMSILNVISWKKNMTAQDYL